MKLTQRIDAFVYLGEILSLSSNNCLKNDQTNRYNQLINEVIINAKYSNPWFIEPFVRFSMAKISESLSRENIQNWLNEYDYKLLENDNEKKIAIIMAGNIPLVGFYDLLSVLISGNKAIVKESSKDPLIKNMVDLLISIEPEFRDYIFFENATIHDFDAVIATGSNNSKRYFDYYFSSYPSIIRGHRNSIAVLTGNETEQELEKLSDDVFTYFGLGCRNVSKIYIPKNFEIGRLIRAFSVYENLLINNSKYFNNYEYYKSIYLVNKTPFYDSGFAMLKKDESLVSPISVVYFEEYNSQELLNEKLIELKQQIQCVVSNNPFFSEIKLGYAQSPRLNDYADGIDVLNFCIEMKKK